MAKKKHGKMYEVERPNGFERYSHAAVSFMLFVLFFYFEMVLRYSTIKGMLWPQGAVIALFNAAAAVFVMMLTSLSPSRRFNRGLRAAVLLLMGFIYGANYFIFLQFKIFYDLNTVLAGSTDVVRDFSDQIFLLLGNRNGIIHVAAFLAPFVWYLIRGKKYDTGRQLTMRAFLESLLGGALVVNTVLTSITADPLMKMFYGPQYSYPMAISSFGFMTGVRLDLQKALRRPSRGIGFETAIMDYEPEEIPTAEDGEETKEPIANAYREQEAPVYGKNVMNIDFAAIEENATAAQKDLDQYVQSQKPTSQNAYTGLFKGKNLIFITAEAFTAEAIDPERTPTLYRLANRGIQFTDYYQPASSGTTGGEFENIFGMLPMLGGSSLKITSNYNNYMTIGSQLDRQGYHGWAFHNNDYTFYDRHLTHNNLGYSHGFMGYGNGMEEYVESQWPQSDLEMIEGTMDLYMDAQPFNVYYMSVSGHNGYTLADNAMTRKHWDEVRDLDYSDEVKGYIACNLELEAALKALVDRLETEGILDDTVIVLGADHFPYGLDYNGALGEMPYLSELYGYTVTSYLERDHNRLIIWSGCLEKENPIVVDAPVSSLDILPTLSNLFGTEFDSRLFPGRDVFSEAEALIFDLSYDWKTELGTYLAWSGRFEPVDENTVIPEGYTERITAIVKNKIRYCEGVENMDYFGYLFADRGWPDGKPDENDEVIE